MVWMTGLAWPDCIVTYNKIENKGKRLFLTLIVKAVASFVTMRIAERASVRYNG